MATRLHELLVAANAKSLSHIKVRTVTQLGGEAHFGIAVGFDSPRAP